MGKRLIDCSPPVRLAVYPNSTIIPRIDLVLMTILATLCHHLQTEKLSHILDFFIICHRRSTVRARMHHDVA